MPAPGTQTLQEMAPGCQLRSGEVVAAKTERSNTFKTASHDALFPPRPQRLLKTVEVQIGLFVEHDGFCIQYCFRNRKLSCINRDDREENWSSHGHRGSVS